MKVLQIGPYPPYLGGISIHVQRFVRWLLEHNIDVHVLDLHYNGPEQRDNFVFALRKNRLGQLPSILKIARQIPPDTLVHFHVAVLNQFKWIAPFLLFLFRRNPKVISLHAGELTWQQTKPIVGLYYSQLFRQFDHFVPVNIELAEYLTDRFGIAEDRITVIPAYIRQEPDPDLIPPEIQELAGKKRLVITSGDLLNNYHHDTLIDCIDQLDPDRYAFVFAFYFDSDPEYAQRIQARLAPHRNVIIYHNLPPEVYVSIVSVCDIYVRTRVTDGDSIAVREAEDFGLTVFAGDTVWRPSSCKLFSLADSSSLLKLFKEYEKTGSPSNNSKLIGQKQTNADRLFEVYERVMRDRREI